MGIIHADRMLEYEDEKDFDRLRLQKTLCFLANIAILHGKSMLKRADALNFDEICGFLSLRHEVGMHLGFYPLQQRRSEALMEHSDYLHHFFQMQPKPLLDSGKYAKMWSSIRTPCCAPSKRTEEYTS